MQFGEVGREFAGLPVSIGEARPSVMAAPTDAKRQLRNGWIGSDPPVTRADAAPPTRHPMLV